MLLYDDEGFSLSDNIKRRKLYRALHDDDAPLFDASHRPESVIALNFTARHFTQEGATQLEHLDADSRDLLSMLFSAYAFVCGRKKRLTTTSPAALERRRQQQRQRQAPGEGEEGGAAAANNEMIVDETDRQQNYFHGADQVSLTVETLLTADAQGLRVSGYRFQFFDCSTDGGGVDLLTRGLQECLAEAQAMRAEIQAELRNPRAQPGAKKTTGGSTGAAAKTPEVKPHYRYYRMQNYPMFQTLCAAHFAGDDLLWQQAGAVADGRRAYFVDRRAFLAHNQTEESQARTDFETLPQIFQKETAMLYHAESADVVPAQRCLAQYYSENGAAIRDAMTRLSEARDPERLAELLGDEVKDREFRQFPLPSVTYRYDPQFICAEMLPHTPLPHRLGTYLYTSEHRRLVQQRIAASRDDDDMDEEQEDSQRTLTPLGLHDVELEVTPELFHTHSQYCSEEVLQALASGSSGGDASVPENAKASFMSRVRNAVHLALLTVVKSVGEKKAYFVEQTTKRATGSHSTEAAPSAAMQTTEAGALRNSDKRYALDRRVYAVVGRTAAARLKDRQKMLASCNMAYYRQEIGRWRPIAATVENAVKHCRNLKYDPVFLERDIYWVLDSLNEEGFANLDRHYFDPRTGEVRAGALKEYLEAKRLFIEAITAEFFHEFFHNARVSPANAGIRNDLRKSTTVGGARKAHRLGMRLKMLRYDRQVMPFHAYMLWTYAYFTEVCGISRLFKPMNTLFHAKYHHCRTYAPNKRDPKMNVIMLGHGMVGKSHLLASVRLSSPSDVCIGVSHWTNQAFNVDQNVSDICMIQDEMTAKLTGSNAANKNNAGHSDGGQDDAKNNAKERATGHESNTMSFYVDEETGDRRMRVSKAQNQFVMLGASNVAEEEIDPNVKSRFICLSVARSMQESVGDRATDKTRDEIGCDSEIQTEQVEEVREVHRLYFMMECMAKSGIFQNRAYGVNVNAAQIYLKKILDLLASKYAVNTNNIRKRTFIMEMARTLELSKDCWWTLKSPEERELFLDPYTREYIGLNPRVLLDGVGKLLVVGKGAVIMAVTLLSCLWGHEHEDKVLETFAVRKCGLDKLKEASFLHRPREDVGNSNIGATALAHFDRRRRAGDAGAQGDGEFLVDYNYVVLTMQSESDIHAYLAASMGDVCIAASEISHILREYSKQFLLSDGYVLRVVNGRRRLVASGDPEQVIQRKIVDRGKDARTGYASIAIHVGFLRQKLSHLLEDALIEDLTHREYGLVPPVVPVEGEEPPTEEPSQDDDDPELVTVDAEERMAALHARLQRVLVVQKGSASDTPIMKAIREVLEHDILQWSGEQSAADEAEDARVHCDLVTGRDPCFSFVTADAPPPQPIQALYPDLNTEYAQLHGANKELLLVNKLAVLELERKRGCRPFVTFNYNTASAGALSSLGVHSGARGGTALGYEEGGDDDDEDEVALYDQDAEDARTPQQRAAASVERRAVRAREEAAARERQLVIAKARYRMYATEPVFYATVDVDYTECHHHLLLMAYPASVGRSRYGYLRNYEPHMYYNMMRHRDAREARTGEERPLVPLYVDIVAQVATQRKIIEAALDRTPEEERRTYTQLCLANYDAGDLRDLRDQERKYVRRDAEQCEKHARRKAGALACVSQSYRLTALVPNEPPPRTRKSTARPLAEENPGSATKRARHD